MNVECNVCGDLVTNQIHSEQRNCRKCWKPYVIHSACFQDPFHCKACSSKSSSSHYRVLRRVFGLLFMLHSFYGPWLVVAASVDADWVDKTPILARVMGSLLMSWFGLGFLIILWKIFSFIPKRMWSFVTED